MARHDWGSCSFGHLLDQVEIIEQDRAVGPHRQRMLLAGDRDAASVVAGSGFGLDIGASPHEDAGSAGTSLQTGASNDVRVSGRFPSLAWSSELRYRQPDRTWQGGRDSVIIDIASAAAVPVPTQREHAAIARGHSEPSVTDSSHAYQPSPSRTSSIRMRRWAVGGR
jgi:hypothetical protein